MTFLTNAGADDRLNPMLRRLFNIEHDEQGIRQDWEAIGKRNARERVTDYTPLVLEAQRPITVDGVQYEDVRPAFVFDEPEYDESVPFIKARLVECTWWPFKPKNARAGFRPQMGPKAWEQVYAGYYCLRCRRRHESQWPEQCHACGLTETHRERAFEHLERVGEAIHKSGPNRAQRRAMARRERRTQSGVVIPAGMGGGI